MLGANVFELIEPRSRLRVIGDSEPAAALVIGGVAAREGYDRLAGRTW
jgi:hypothetical protein